MKSQIEIRSFTNKIRAASVVDKELIEDFILKSFGIKISIKTRYRSLPPIDFNQFLCWYDTDLPQKGDIIYLEEHNVLGIVKVVNADSIILGAYLKDEKLVCVDLSIPFCKFRKATDNETLLLQRSLYEGRLRWSNFKSGICQMHQFESNDYVRITRIGKLLGHGIYKQIDEGNLVMHCVKMSDEPIRYNLHEIIGKVEDFQLEIMTPDEKKIFNKVLSEENKEWNGHREGVVPINGRVKHGESYFYIDDYNEVQVALDFDKNKDRKRWVRYNYFLNRVEAEEIIRKIIQERNRQFVLKEV